MGVPPSNGVESAQGMHHIKRRTRHFGVAVAAICFLALSCSKSNQRAPESKSSTASNSSEPAVELKVKWPGKKAVQRMAITSTAQMNMPKTKQPVAQVTDMSLDYSIIALKQREDGGHEIEVEFVSTKMESKVGDRVYVSFDSQRDSAKQAADVVTSALRKIVGAKLRYVLGPDNKVEKLDGYEDFMVRIARGSKNPEMLKPMFGEDSLKMLCNWTEALPDHPVKPGDTWKNATEMNVYGMAKILIDGTFTFKEWADRGGHKCAKLDFDGTITGKSSPNAPFTIENGTLRGSSWFDPKLGMLVGSDTDERMTVKIQQGRNSMSQQINQNVTLSLME
jgi:hypothetical protein